MFPINVNGLEIVIDENTTIKITSSFIKSVSPYDFMKVYSFIIVTDYFSLNFYIIKFDTKFYFLDLDNPEILIEYDTSDVFRIKLYNLFNSSDVYRKYKSFFIQNLLIELFKEITQWKI